MHLGTWAAGRGPLYRQLADALARSIERGDLQPGTVLPAERTLAESLAVSRTTLVSALDELKRRGWLESRRGSATWVSGVAAGEPESRAAMLARDGAMRPFARGRGAHIDLTFDAPPPLPMVSEALTGLSRLSLEDLTPAHGYVPAGTPELRSAIARRLAGEGVPTTADQVLVTTGAQQALSLLAAYYLRAGDAVALEDPGFPNAFDVFRAAGAELLALPVDGEGVSVDALEEMCAARPPRLVYITPTHQSPTGTVLAASRRRQLARVAERYRVPILEDTALADIPLGDEPAPPAVAHHRPDGPILLIGSMSKLFWGGLRVGWVRAPRAVIRQLVRLKLMADIATPLLSQLVATALIERTEEARGLRRAQYGPRLERLTQVLTERLPDWSWIPPAGGFTLWARLPAGSDATAFAAAALRNGVAVVPGPRLSTEERHRDCLRLAFMLDSEKLSQGVERLARLWERVGDSPAARPEDPAPTVFV